MPELRPQTDHADARQHAIGAIEAALDAAPWPCEHGKGTDPEAWFTCDRCTATTAYDAMAPLIRREYAEEAARRLRRLAERSPGLLSRELDDAADLVLETECPVCGLRINDECARSWHTAVVGA
jgi:hypothetical protein